MTTLTEEELEDVLKRNPELKVATAPPKVTKPHKYNAIRTEYGGVKYASKKEAAQAQKLGLMVKAGEIDFYLRQVPFDLGAGITYRADFVTFKYETVEDEDIVDILLCWQVRVIEVKGMSTLAWKLKHKLFKEKYPNLRLEVV